MLEQWISEAFLRMGRMIGNVTWPVWRFFSCCLGPHVTILCLLFICAFLYVSARGKGGGE